jgi:hypothetical protein
MAQAWLERNGGRLWAHLTEETNTCPHPPSAARDGGGRPRGKPNPRNEILQIAGRGKHFARRAPLLLFLPAPRPPPPRARSSLYKYSLPGSASFPLLQFHPVPSSRPVTSPQSRSTAAAAHHHHEAASTLRIRRYRTCLSSCRNVAISLFFPFFERHLSRFIVCANPSIAEFLTPCLRFFPLCTRWSRPEQRLYRGMRCLFLE